MRNQKHVFSLRSVVRNSSILPPGVSIFFITGYIFDVSTAKEYLGPGKLLNVYTGKDISCALARFSWRDEDINVVGHSCLLGKELVALDQWVSVFMCVRRFLAMHLN